MCIYNFFKDDTDLRYFITKLFTITDFYTNTFVSFYCTILTNTALFLSTSHRHKQTSHCFVISHV